MAWSTTPQAAMPPPIAAPSSTRGTRARRPRAERNRGIGRKESAERALEIDRHRADQRAGDERGREQREQRAVDGDHLFTVENFQQPLRLFLSSVKHSG